MLAALGMAAVTHPLSLIARFKDGSHLAADDIIGTVRGNPSLASEVDAETGNRPLHYACCNRAPLPVVQALLTANPKAARLGDADGNLPIHGAVANGCTADVIKILLDAHPDSVRARQGEHTLCLLYTSPSPRDS